MKRLQPPASSLQQKRGVGGRTPLRRDVSDLPAASERPLKDRLAGALIFTALTISPMKIPFPRLDPAPPPAAVLPVGDPTPGIGAFRG
jgi:hypothetical protein